MNAAKIKEWKLSKYKKTVPLFLYFEGQIHPYPSVCYTFVEVEFNINLCTLVTKYTIILNF